MDAKKKRLMAVLLVVGFTFVGLTMLIGCGKDESPSEPNAVSSEHDHDHGPGGHTHEHAETAMTSGAGKEIAGAEQTTCPVMEGNKINKQYFVEYEGKKVYFCCPGCDKKFLAAPEKYIAKLPQFKE
ncbi:MAG: YHS domain-containing protein [Planctomycetota bacterium]|jgi:YHS domain-containing protein